MARIGAVDHGERVEFDVVLFQQAQPAENLVVGIIPLFVHPVGVMQPRRSVDAQADEKLFRLQEFAPFVVEQRAVGLDGIVDAFAAGILPLQLDDFAEELHPEQRRFPTLPGECDFRNILPYDVLPHIGLEDLIGHFKILV